MRDRRIPFIVLAFGLAFTTIGATARTPILSLEADAVQGPIAYDLVVTTRAGASVSGLLTGSGPGTGSAFQLVASATNGIATLLDASSGAFTYQPAVGFTGLDQFTFQVSDGATWSESGTVFVFVTIAGTPDMSRVSVDSGGGQANNSSSLPSISADGRYVAFVSNATSFVTNAPFPGIYVHDRINGTTSLVSKTTGGTPLRGTRARPSLSADGRFVTFTSNDAGFVNGDVNNSEDVFVHDRLTGQTVCVSVTPAGVPGNGRSSGASISADGRFVSFASSAFDLVLGDTNGRSDIFVRDLGAQTTERVSIASDGSQANNDSTGTVTITADGRMVAFGSLASNLSSDDSAPACSSCGMGGDIFVRDRRTNQTQLISRGPDGLPNNQSNHSPSISGDGRVVTFSSSSSSYFPDRPLSSWLAPQVIAVDLRTGESHYVAVTNSGVFPSGQASDSPPALSADGRFVSFTSFSTDLVADDTNGKRDVFVFDRAQRTIRRASQRPDGIAQDGHTGQPGSSISADGRSVTFDSGSNNLVAFDTFSGTDVFVTDFEVSAPTAAITGSVTSVAVPRGGVEVRVFNSAGFLWATGVSDSNGSYSIVGPQPGTYWLHTSNTLGYVDEAWGGVSCLPACYPLSGVPLIISAGSPASSIDFNLERQGGISGTVTSALAGAVAGVRLAAFDFSEVLRATATTDLAGEYEFPDLSPGSYRVQIVHAPGYHHQAYPAVACTPACNPSQGEAVEVVASATTGGVNFGLAPLAVADSAYLVFGTSGRNLTVADTRTHQLVATVPLSDHNLSNVAVAPDGGLVYVAAQQTAEVFVIDTARLEVVRHIAVAPNPQHLALSPDGTRLYVAHTSQPSGVTTVIDTTNDSVLMTLPRGGSRIVLTPAGDRAILLGLTLDPNTPTPAETFLVIDTTSNQFSSSITIHTSPDCFCPSRVDNLVFGANGRAFARADMQLFVLNADTLEVIERRAMNVPTMGVSLNRQVLYMPHNNRFNTVYYFDAFLSSTLEPIQSLQPASGPEIISIPDGRTLYVGDRVIDLASGAVIASVPLGLSRAVSQVPQQGVYPTGLTATYGTVVTLTSRLVKNGLPLAGKTISFQTNGVEVGSSLTDAEGLATLAGVSLAGIDVGGYLITASFAGDPSAPPSSRTARLTIEPAMPVITWTPSPLAVGLPLGPAQLNATSNVPGSFAYTPSAGSSYPAGALYIVAMFTPEDGTNYLPLGDSRTVPVYFATQTSRLTVDSSASLGWATDMALDGVTNTLYLTRHGVVDIFNGHSHAPVGSLVLPPGTQAAAVAVSAASERVFVATYAGISIFDRGTRALLEVVGIPAYKVAVDGITNLVYALGQGQLWIFDPLLPPGDPSRITSIPTAGCPDSLSFNPSSRLLYVSGNCGYAQALETDPAKEGYHSFIATWPELGQMAVDRITNRIYAATALNESEVPRLRVLQASRNSGTLHATLAEMQIAHQDPTSFGFTGLSVDASRGRLYAFSPSYNIATVLAFDLSTDAVVSAWPVLGINGDSFGRLLTNPVTNRVYIYTDGITLVDPVATSVTLPADEEVAPISVEVGTASLTFSDLTTGGSVSAETFDPGTANLTLPGQFSLSGAAGYEVSTTAGFVGAITICFDMSSVLDPDGFSALRVLHGENGAWVDRTVSSDFETGKICGSVASLSPFALGSYTSRYQVERLFDNTKAFRSGSTIPLKIRLMGDALNVSSSLVTVNAKRLRRISTGTTTETQDSGHSSPEGNFRYSLELDGYVFNLSTKGLLSGTYELTFRAAGDPTLHTLQFQIK